MVTYAKQNLMCSHMCVGDWEIMSSSRVKDIGADEHGAGFKLFDTILI